MASLCRSAGTPVGANSCPHPFQTCRDGSAPVGADEYPAARRAISLTALTGTALAIAELFLSPRALPLNHDPPHAVATSTPSTLPSKPWSIGGVKLFGDDGFNFRDVLDLINPLQHIPIIGNIYRSLTGDVAAPVIRVAGGALFGGALGAAFAAANVVLKQIVKPDAEVGPLPAAGTAVAARSVAGTSRHADRIMNAHALPLPTAAMQDRGRPLAGADEALLKHAYGLGEIEKQRRHLFASFHYTA